MIITAAVAGGTCTRGRETPKSSRRNRWSFSLSGRSIHIPGIAMERLTGRFAGSRKRPSVRRRASRSWGWTIGAAIVLPIGATRGVRTGIGDHTWIRSISQLRPLVATRHTKDMLKRNRKIEKEKKEIAKITWAPRPNNQSAVVASTSNHGSNTVRAILVCPSLNTRSSQPLSDRHEVKKLWTLVTLGTYGWLDDFRSPRPLSYLLGTTTHSRCSFPATLDGPKSLLLDSHATPSKSTDNLWRAWNKLFFKCQRTACPSYI